MSAVLDTHAAVWYFHHVKRLSLTALQTIRRSPGAGRPIYVSCISLIETIYLVERDEEVAKAFQKISSSTVPEMPDRIIAATALHLDIPLITRDQRLQASGIKTIW